jgi:hypothetical protein
METDETGRYEFSAGPGDYYLILNGLTDVPQLTITDELEIEKNLALSTSPEGKLSGRVVTSDTPERGAAEIAVTGYPEERFGIPTRAVTDKEGRFESRLSGSPMLFWATSTDKSLAAIERTSADQTNVTIHLAPTATVSAVVIDEETGKPAADREMTAFIRIGQERGPYVQGCAVTTKTDAAGRFILPGLVVGGKYDLDVVLERDDEGRPRSWQTLSKTAPTSAGDVALGELRIPKRYRPPTVDDDIKRAYSYKDVDARYKQLLNDAKLAYNKVLILAASPTGKAARSYFAIRHFGNDGNSPPEILFEYMVLTVDPAKDAAFLTQHKLAVPASSDGATFTILDPDGSVIAAAASDLLSENGRLDRKLLSDFLSHRRAPLPNARKLLDDALAQAKREDKRVLVQVGGPGCGWCVVLSRYLDGQKALVEKDYVHLKIDNRMPDAQVLIGELREKKEGGVPWMIILDADGKPLITSDAESGNIGYPGEPESQVHWKKMLDATRHRLTDDDVAALMKPLEKTP